MCPLGFHIDDGSCKCNEGLKGAFPNLQCSIQSSTITHPGGSWIGSTSIDGQQIILYIKNCERLFCNKHATDVQLDP